VSGAAAVGLLEGPSPRSDTLPSGAENYQTDKSEPEDTYKIPIRYCSHIDDIDTVFWRAKMRMVVKK
jgi:hypothetical protein